MDIRVNNISKSFNDKIVIQNFSTVIYKNMFNFVMGPSGCGKTTLLNMLMGFLMPENGEITGIPDKKSAVFQEDRLCETFSAVSNIRMVCHNNIDIQTIKDHLSSIGITGVSLKKPVSELSGGMRRRVAIVRAMLAESEIIFMDEPFKGLDKDTKHTVIQYVLSNVNNKTIVFVTHDINEVNCLGGNLINMDMIK